MIRTVVFAAAVAVLVTPAVPAFAGPAEQAFLAELNASWIGKGTIKPDGGAIGCRLKFTSGATASALYQGRCTVPDMGGQTFNGTIVYNDALNRYEARSLQGTVVGEKHGDQLVFTNEGSEAQGNSYSKMILSPMVLVMDFNFADGKGANSAATVTFGPVSRN
jgi:hypothetical protein